MTVIDLFAGCGGMSLGFELAGFRVIGASEVDLWASETYRHNNPRANVLVGDIRQQRDLDCLAGGSGFSRVDAVVGGPPCQGFSLSGNRDPRDPRNSLFMEFIRAIRHFKPRCFVMENVTGLLSMKTADKHRVIDIIHSEASAAGYRTAHCVLNAANFGVPQKRERVFIVGVSTDLPFDRRRLFPQPSIRPGEYITVEMAISDLPPIHAGEGEEQQGYYRNPSNAFQEWVREGSSAVFNHVAMRHTQRLIERFKIIKHGQSVAHVPHEHSAHKRGNPSIKSGKIFGQNNMRVFADHPAPTVAASFQSNFIHPHLHRNFTAREGARLQSFPDTFIFKGKRTTMSWEKHLSQYQQIGNAVPPLLALAIASNLRDYLKDPTILDDFPANGHEVSSQMQLFVS
jgi:DNA (cytosine-5)-methyltransferase 1